MNINIFNDLYVKNRDLFEPKDDEQAAGILPGIFLKIRYSILIDITPQINN